MGVGMNHWILAAIALGAGWLALCAYTATRYVRDPEFRRRADAFRDVFGGGCNCGVAEMIQFAVFVEHGPDCPARK